MSSAVEAAGPASGRRLARAAPFLLLGLFLGVQLWTIDYGARVNDPPWIRDGRIDPAALQAADSALTRESVVDSERDSPESNAKRLMRFRIYSVEADEHVNLIALARVRPAALELDPHFYQYGGAYLYPLGAWYFALLKTGIIERPNLATLLDDPDRVDRLYAWGRTFVLGAFTVSALLFLGLARRLLPERAATLALGLYLFAPMSLKYSTLMKPHWYALAFAVPAIALIVRWYAGEPITRGRLAALGACLGLAVGSATTYGLLAVLAWLALAGLVRRGAAGWRALAGVPAVALAGWVVTNPFLFANRAAASFESRKAAAWFAPSLRPEDVLAFVDNSLIPGLGVLGILLPLFAVREVFRPSFAGSRGCALAVLASVLAAAAATSSISGWSTNARYVAFLLPAGCLYLARVAPGRGAWVLAVCLALTILQGVPLKIGYADENDPAHSTRLRAARWLADHAPPGSRVCLKDREAAPFNAPPLDFRALEIRDRPPCDYAVAIAARPDGLPGRLHGLAPAADFLPRLAPHAPWYLWDHVNPPVRVYSAGG